MKTVCSIALAALALITLVPQSNAVLYLGRAYDPNLQRWITRDPIGERGGINLHAFVKNGAPNFVDPFGWAEQMVGFSIDRSGTVSPVYAPYNSFQNFGLGHNGPLPVGPIWICEWQNQRGMELDPGPNHSTDRPADRSIRIRRIPNCTGTVIKRTAHAHWRAIVQNAVSSRGKHWIISGSCRLSRSRGVRHKDHGPECCRYEQKFTGADCVY